jgi:hypothetical protein
MRAWRKEIMACQEMTEACLEKVKANPEKTKAGLEEMEAMVDVFKEKLSKIGTTDLEANPEEKETIAEQREVHNEEAAVEMIRALMDQSGGQRLAVKCCGP